MRTYSILLISLFWISLAASTQAASERADPITDFIVKRHGSANFVASVSQLNTASEQCIKTSSHYICIKTQNCSHVLKNPVARQSVLQALALKNKNALYNAASKDIIIKKFNDQKKVKEAYCFYAQTKKQYAIHSVEHILHIKNNLCYSIASMAHNNINITINNICNSDDFIYDYYKYTQPEIKNLLENKQYAEVTQRLDEFSRYKIKNADVYLDLAFALMKVGKNEDAKNVASELIVELHQQMTSAQAEKLGDIFWELACEDKAQQAFTLAIEKFNGNSPNQP